MPGVYRKEDIQEGVAMARFKVALASIDGTMPDWVAAEMAAAGVDFVVDECTTREQLADLAGDADVVWFYGGSTVLTPETIEVIPRCGAIIRTGSGTDNIPIAAATQRGILVANTPTAHTDGVSDHAIALLFAVMRQIALHDRAVRAGSWDRNLGLPYCHLHHQTLGLVGFGHIPRMLARKLSGFELQVLACDPFVDEALMSAEGVHPATLDEVLSQSDFVSLHCPLTATTRHLIGERELRLLKKRAILINTARGPVIEEKALTRALSEGWFGGAGLDVLDPEPPDPKNPLLQLPNVVVSPHIAGFSDESVEATWRLSVDTALALAAGRLPPSYVNPEVKPRWNLS